MFKVKREPFPKEHSLDTRKDHKSPFKQLEEGCITQQQYWLENLGGGVKNWLMEKAKIYLYLEIKVSRLKEVHIVNRHK